MTIKGMTPLDHNLQTLINLSMTEGYCDITFRSRAPLIGVRLKPTLNAALMYSAGASKMLELFRHVETKSGESFNAEDVWVIVPLPNGDPTPEELAAVDLADGEAEVASGVTMRQMAKEIYHCSDEVSTDSMLRRILAA